MTPRHTTQGRDSWTHPYGRSKHRHYRLVPDQSGWRGMIRDNAIWQPVYRSMVAVVMAAWTVAGVIWLFAVSHN